MAMKLQAKSYNVMIKDLQIDDSGMVQKYLGKLITDRLRDYVSYKSGAQEASISYTNGKKEVVINVAYADYQAYSKYIKKRVGKRGTQPFERMMNDNKNTIKTEISAYSKKVVE